MAESFKVPSIPMEESPSDDTAIPAATTTTTASSNQPHAPLVQPELPPANFSTPVRHKNLQYTVPDSSETPPLEYTLEVLRGGSIIDYVSLTHRPYTVFGRSPDSDVVLEHPTISRYHAIIQYKAEFEHGQSAGLYMYDCGSTHGTFVNKKRLEPKVYVRIKIGHIIKFGQSTRLYLVQGDSAAELEHSHDAAGDDVTHEQMKAFHAKRAKMLAAVRAKRENAASDASNNDPEMDWGMGPDIDEAASIAAAAAATAVPVSPVKEAEVVRDKEEIKKIAAVNDMRNRLEYQKAKNDQAVLKDAMSAVDEPIEDDDETEDGKKEPFYLKEPKRVLMAFFEREGAELVYDVEDRQFGSYRCTIKLPIVDDYGRSVQAECEEKHCKRKEIIHQCVVEACRILDDHGVLREGTAASSVNTPRVQQIKRQLLEENDFYEEDEDTFYDRTGDLEKKRLKRMEWSGRLTQDKHVETFDSLCEKLSGLYREEIELEQKLETARLMEEAADRNAAKADRDVDEVDLYIRQLKQGEKVNMKVKWQWKKRLIEIQNEERQHAKLLRVCKPKEFDIPTWRKQVQEEIKQQLTRQRPAIPPPPPPPAPKLQMLPPPPPPALPTPTPVLASEPESIQTTSKPITSRRKATRSKANSKDQFDDSDHYSEEKFAEWMPPDSEQTGDGRTALNEKYGY